MTEFDKYLKRLAKHESKKSGSYLKDPRRTILVHAGIHLSWLGDFLSNPKLKWRLKTIPLNDIEMTGTRPEWNKIFIDKAGRSPKKLKELVSNNKRLSSRVSKWVKRGKDEIILLRRHGRKYRTLDGMHRFVRAVMEGKKSVRAYVPTNESNVKPICEPHVVYDLLRAFQRSKKDKQRANELYHALRFLMRSYDNVRDLLRKRFSEAWVHDKETQAVIKKALKNS